MWKEEPHWANPNEYKYPLVFSRFYCLSQGASGGRSTLASAVAAFNQVTKERPDLALVLQKDFWFDARGQHPTGRLCQVHPIFSWFQEKLSVGYVVQLVGSYEVLDEKRGEDSHLWNHIVQKNEVVPTVLKKYVSLCVWVYRETKG